MSAVTQNHSDFAARLARIEENVASAKQVLFVGVDEVYLMPRRKRGPKVSPTRAMLHNATYPISLVAAVLLGVASHGIGQVLRYYVQGVPDLKGNPDVETLVQIILGILISMLLGFAFRLHSRSFTTLKSTGVVAGILGFHNFVHMWPSAFAALTSQLWVTQVLTTTKAHSLVWRGISFML